MQRLPCFPVQVKCDSIDEALSVMRLQEDILRLENCNIPVAEMIDTIAESPRMGDILSSRTQFWGVINGHAKLAIIYLT